MGDLRPSGSTPLRVIVGRRYQVVVSEGFSPVLLGAVIRSLEELS
jgi:hypothetical protein